MLVQLAFTALTNGYAAGFAKGSIYKGPGKFICLPGLNCYSCPGALGSCPIGSLQAVIGSRSYRFSFYIAGFLLLFGALFGRLVCGWLCPFGLVQDLLYKIPFVKKLRRLPGDRWLKYLKYVILAGFVIVLPLTVLDIDPAYTLGDMIRKRMEIIRQLKEEGVFTLNKELPLPTLPKRVAVITSPTAAGYEDFLNQLANNKAGYPFYPKLFPALMQGERTEESVIAALDRVYRHADCFDVVVIIRGGGATSDLNSFDSYLLAANCAQFPLPIITGIGHERDDTILDMVAHTRMKTPTAVAEFLIGQMDKAAGEVEELQQDVCSLATEILSRQKNFLQSLGSRLPVLAINRIERNRSLLQRIGMQLPTDAHAFLNQWASKLEAMQVRLANRAESSLAERSRFVQLTEQFIKMASPDYVLKRGYSLTLKDGKIIKQADGLVVGDELITRFADGEVRSKVLKK